MENIINLDTAPRITELEKKIAVLEYRAQKQQECLKILKNGLNNIEQMLIRIKDDPFGLKS